MCAQRTDCLGYDVYLLGGDDKKMEWMFEIDNGVGGAVTERMLGLTVNTGDMDVASIYQSSMR